ncbi:hypothetical protein BGW38_002064 [Lunasporangiospora selenospora]|uniref:AAA domain-containing protein n=1 Tax=Lunasporangiospora selenospora TaxID=979761 RepID=A0A9P6FTR6_9FUNG|nr:hypothetical protein BGW38_002064 [Lunasporangiospora selenospora]
MLFQSGSLGRGRGGATGSGSDSYWGSRDQGLRGFQNSDRARGGHRGDRGGHGGRGGRGGRGELSTEDRNQIMIARREETLQVAMTEGTDDIICAASAPDETFQNFAIHVLDQWVVEAYDCWAVRRFINSCLVNLSNHHSVDVSRLIPALATSNGLGRLNKLMSMTMIIDGGDGDYMCQGQLSFQYDVLPLVGVLTREKVCLATLTTESNAIYNTVYSHRKKFLEDGILPCMARLITRGSIEDGIVSSDKMNRIKSYACSVKSLQRALLAVVRLVFQLIKRIREARLELAPIVVALYEQAKGSRSLTGTSSNERYLNDIVVKELERLKRMTSDIEERNVATLQTREKVRPTQLRAHYYAYDPPGNLSIYGARHGNDEVNIKEISILPALDEIVCQRSPFLPANGFSEAVHFHDPGWRRQLDIHFRLYREDLVNPLRKGVIGFMEILDMIPRSQERDVLNPKELRKFLPRGLLRVYKIVQILKVDIDWNEGPGLLISIEQPAQLRGMDAEARKMFWERAKNRLMSGGLVSLVRRATLPIDQKSSDLTIEDKFEMHLAVVMGKNIKSLSKDENLAYISITSSDPELYSLLFASDTNKNQWYLIETAGGYLEASRPILKALQNADPAMLPFGRYLAPTIQEMEMNAKEPGHISPPIYATAPEFQFDLSVLLNGRNVNLDVRSPSSARSAVRALQDYSNLDHTQAEALVESLCREVALISGPPGTGKTKIGVDIMRVLLRNREEMNCGPILCICYTNYALDQFLEHLLAIGETNIVRIGSRSKSEKLESYSLHNRKQSTQSYFARRAVAIASQRINEYQEKIKHVEEEIKAPRLPWIAVEEFLSNSYPEIYRRLLNGPPLSQDHPSLYRDSAIFNHWINGVDIGDRIKANNDNRERLRKLRFRVLDMDELESRYRIPMTNRPLEELDNDVWEMSRLERKRLFESWRGPIHELLKSTLNDYIQEVNEAVAERQAAHDDSNRQVLQSCSVIGMTTNGAAKMNELISSISPKIILCEEAGEVLESHILSALSPSTQHLILIGDYLQLRPQIETYELSMDSASGKLYKLDQSLFERLVTAQENPLPMSKLTIQRRMRPEISSLIRTTLYPHLQDGPNVHEYPSVTGMCDNIYFMDHDHPENGKDQDGVSFSNAFEVEMIEALALYLIKNGYDKEGDISILTPYLGQLSRLRDELSKSFTLKLDERDQELLDQMDESATRPVQADVSASESAKAIASGKEVSLKNQLTLRTIDNYQGEEAKIIIVSLVRNQSDSISGGIGFLKSPNRTNVLLSRAQHGMFILGNAKLMESKIEFGIWPQIISELREKDRIGKGFRLRCKKHPTTQNIVDKPSALKMCAPKGGCTQPCGYNLCKDPEKIKLVKELLTQDTLAHVNLTENTILILPCGHAMTMTTLEEMTQIQRFNKVRVDKKAGSSSFVSKLQLPGSKLESIKCPHCREPILGSLRYGRQTKYAQLATGLKRHTGDWSAAVFNAQLNLKVALKKLAFEQATSLASLLSSRAEESWTPPLEADRSIAKLVRAKDRLPELSLRLVMHNYNIPPQQVILWRKMTAKLEEAGSYFRNIYENAMKAPTRNVFETVASRLHFSDGLEDDIQERGSEGENWPSDLEDDTENEGESWPSDLEDDAESEGENCNWLVDSDDERSEWMHDESPGHILPSSFSQTSNMAPTKSRPSQLIESESMERAAVPHILRDYIRKCGVPVIGYGGTSHLDALQGLLDVFMTATKLVFMVLDEGYEMTGWYWFQEDLIHGAVKIASKYVEAAREGKFYLRELAGQVHILELIVRQARWRSMQSEAFEFQNPMIEDILGLEQVFKKVYHKVMELYRGLDFDTDEPKHIKKRCGARARALEVYIQV